MKTPRPLILATAVCFGLSASPSFAEEKENGPEDLAREGMGKIVSALEMLLLTIPMYEMPEVLPNGDIIIRRKNPPKPEDRDGEPDTDPNGEPNPI